MAGTVMVAGPWRRLRPIGVTLAAAKCGPSPPRTRRSAYCGAAATIERPTSSPFATERCAGPLTATARQMLLHPSFLELRAKTVRCGLREVDVSFTGQKHDGNLS